MLRGGCVCGVTNTVRRTIVYFGWVDKQVNGSELMAWNRSDSLMVLCSQNEDSIVALESEWNEENESECPQMDGEGLSPYRCSRRGTIYVEGQPMRGHGLCLHRM
jgi:hypothetical protein